LSSFESDQPLPSDLSGRATRVEIQVVAAAQEHLLTPFGGQIAVLAVGGFGRRELFPHSDVDLLLLVESAEQAMEQRDAIAHFLRELWDSNLEPSHSVHTVEECCQLDAANVELTISLISQRRLCGSEALHGRLAARLPEFLRLQRRSVTAHLLRLSEVRHAKFQSTIYHLEPDVKDSPGGIRDLHLIEWLGGLRGAPFEESLEALKPARAFLAELRTRLHRRIKRDDNRLTYHAQDELFADPEDAMREYYRHARHVYREVKQVIAQCDEPGSGMLRSFLDWRSRLSNSEFTVSREKVLLRSPQMLASDPKLPIRLMQFVARHGFQLAPDTERRLIELVRGGATIPQFGLWRDLRNLLSLPYAARALRVMHETGLLKVILPEWSRIECLVTRDFYHRYTVDEHTLVTIESLEHLAASKEDDRTRFRELLAETPDLYLLRVALLLHDIGKGGGTGEHATESTRIATEVLARLGADEVETATVLYLVEQHIALSILMTTRDLHDPEVARQAAHGIGAIERLQLLTLLTFADISGVNPTAMTPWRMAQLWGAYRALSQELTRELDTDRILPEPSVDEAKARFLEGFPTRYLRMHSAAEVDGHFAMFCSLPGDGAAVELVPSGGYWQLTVVSRDRKGLLADLAGTLASFGMNILKAEALGNAHGVIVDMLRFADTGRRLELNPEEVPDLRMLIERVVRGEESVAKRLKGRPATQPPSRRVQVPPSIRFDTAASSRATLLEVVAQDRPGLLYDLARAISEAGCNIEVVLVNTEAHKALDAFYLTHSGGAVPVGVRGALRESLLRILTA
jgi:[protein-PII] uridylyltransferase